MLPGVLVIPARCDQAPGNRPCFATRLCWSPGFGPGFATGKPVLCIGPADGDAADVVNELANGKAVDYTDSDGITGFITRAFDGSLPSRELLPESFSRKAGAAALAAILVTDN